MLWTRQLITLWFANNYAKTTTNSYQREIIFIIAHTKILYSILGSAYCHQIMLFLRILICLPRFLYFYLKKICERIHSLLLCSWKETEKCRTSDLLYFPTSKILQKYIRIWFCYFILYNICLVWVCKGGNIVFIKICGMLVSATFCLIGCI